MAAELRFFPPFRLDSNNEQLWRGSREIHLRRKTFAVLRHLVERPGQLVTKAALLDAIWPDVSVSDSMPAHSVRELREALGDAAQTPRFIETVQGRGYRFIADVKLEPVHAPTTPAARQSAFAVQPQQTLFVGREHERSEIRGALADATSGRGRICLISGEAGIGKTRLCAEIAREAEKKGLTVLVGHCSEQEAVPYLPFVEILESWVDRCQSPDDLRRAMGEEGPELGRLLPKLRRIIPDLPPPLELAAEQARRQLFNSISNFIARRSREQPTMLVLEDLHWADDSTLALINHLSQRHSDLPLLMIATYRESEIDVSPSLSRTLEDLIRGRVATQIRLEGLPSNDVAQMLHGLSGQAPPAALVSEIHGETEGNPFFVEELFRHLAEENRLYDRAGQFRLALRIEELEVPRNVRLVVGRRLGRLGEATRKILALAAVIGRFFSFELLEAATSAKADALLDCLDEAHRVGLIRSIAHYPEARFEFSHELIRQAILTDLSVARHRRLHLDVAETIERIYSDTLEDHYAELAHHYSQTSNTRKAVIYLHLAGQQASRRSAHTEAVSLLYSSLGLLRSLPNTSERDNQELASQTALGWLLIATKGFAAPEVERTYVRAMELCHLLADTRYLFRVQEGLAVHYMLRSQIRKAFAMAKGVLDLVQGTESPSKLAAAHFYFAMPSFWLGELELARAHLQEGISLYESEKRRSPKFDKGPHHLASCFQYLAWNLWYMGYPEQALHAAERALSEAREKAEPFGLASALNQVARFHVLRREAETARELADAGLALANEQGFPTWAAESTLVRGWALAHTGQEPEGITQLENGLAARDAIGETGAQPHYSAWLAEAYGKVGRHKDGLILMARVLEAEHEVLVYEPELYRTKGELFLMLDKPEVGKAEHCFRTALEISRDHHSKSMELRVTTSLARLLHQQDKSDEARATLSEIYNWFSEGFDTADLKEVKALLDELNA